MLLTIKTLYRYSRRVVLLAHRLMLTPRSSHHLTLRSTRVSTSPPAEIEWSQDVFGNLIATAAFSEASGELIVSGTWSSTRGLPPGRFSRSPLMRTAIRSDIPRPSDRLWASC
jgi:hypothetical protein